VADRTDVFGNDAEQEELFEEGFDPEEPVSEPGMAEHELIRIFRHGSGPEYIPEYETGSEKAETQTREAPKAEAAPAQENPGNNGEASGKSGAKQSAKRRRSVKSSVGSIVRTTLLTLLCVAVGIAAAMQYKTVTAKNNALPSDTERISELLSTINNLNSELSSLEAERDELQNRLDLVEQSSQDEQIAALQEELASVRTFAGLTTVKGRGIYIRIDLGERTNVNSVQSRLLMLINELRASGAQAISINGIRILSMTEIRVVNDQYIAVNAHQLVAPFDIYAIGDAANLYSGITMGGSGIVHQISNLAGASCIWETQENIVINACAEEDIKTDLLTDFQ